MSELKPEDVERATFTTKMRGYDPEEVEAFLRKVAEQLRQAEARAERSFEAAGEQMGDLLQHAKNLADSITAEAEADAARMRQEAEADASKARSEASADAARMRAEADADARRTRDEADADAKLMREEASSDAARMRREAEDYARDLITRAEAKVRAIEDAEIEGRARLSDLRADLLEICERLGRIADTPVERTVPAEPGDPLSRLPSAAPSAADPGDGEVTRALSEQSAG